MPKQNKLPFIFINEETVERNTDFKKAYEAIKNSYALFSGGKSTTPKTLSMKVNNGMFFCFPSYLNNRKIFISKLATFYPKNRLKNLPSIQPYISIFDIGFWIFNIHPDDRSCHIQIRKCLSDKYKTNGL